MKKWSIIIALLVSFTSVYGQVQNLSFELWDTVLNEPDYWSTSNYYNIGSAIKTSDAHGGQFALQMKVINDSSGVAVAPFALNMFPLTTMPQVLTFWIKGNLAGNNNFNASFTLAEVDSAANVLAYGDQTFNTVSSVYQYKFLNILQLANPSLLGQGTIYFAINAPVGSTLNTTTTVYIDDIYLGPDNTGIMDHSLDSEVIETFYPNPVEDMGYVVFNLKKYSLVTLQVYDVLGNKIQEVFQEFMPEGKYKAAVNTAALGSGVYLCHLTVDGTSFYKKFTKR